MTCKPFWTLCRQRASDSQEEISKVVEEQIENCIPLHITIMLLKDCDLAGDKAGVEATLASLKAEILARSAAGIR